MSLKSFAGSVDIPKDINRSFVILELAKAKAEALGKNFEKEDLEFYTAYFKKVKALEESKVITEKRKFRGLQRSEQ